METIHEFIDDIEQYFRSTYKKDLKCDEDSLSVLSTYFLVSDPPGLCSNFSSILIVPIWGDSKYTYSKDFSNVKDERDGGIFITHTETMLL